MRKIMIFTVLITLILGVIGLYKYNASPTSVKVMGSSSILDFLTTKGINIAGEVRNLKIEDKQIIKTNGNTTIKATRTKNFPPNIEEVILQTLNTHYIQSIEVKLKATKEGEIQKILGDIKKHDPSSQEILSQNGLWLFLGKEPNHKELIYYALLFQKDGTCSLAIFTERANQYFKQKEGLKR